MTVGEDWRLRADSALVAAPPHLIGGVVRAGALLLDTGRLEADTGRGPVPLTRLEFLLLKELLYHIGQPVPKERLLATVWDCDFDPGSNVVDVCVRRLRSKLGFDLITTVRGKGYQFSVQLPFRDRPCPGRPRGWHGPPQARAQGDKIITNDVEPER